MSTKILDRDKVLALLRTYRPGLAVEKAGGGKTFYKMLCPFHSDQSPSFSFNPDHAGGFCFACKHVATFPQLIVAFEHTSSANAEAIVEKCKKLVKHDPAEVRAKNIDISMAQIITWHEQLNTDSKLQVLFAKWGWTPEVILRLMLGSSDGRLTIPMIEREHLIGLKYYSPGASKLKYQNAEGSTPCCWPLENMEEEVVYLVEGEKDCITMISAGFNAVTFTTGAGAVPREYIRFFAGKTVYIIYDIDEIGRKGAVTVANIINCATKKVFIVELPLEGVPKGDLTDAYMRDPENFAAFINYLVENTTQYEAPAAVSRVTVPPEVHKTYLEDIVPRKLFYRRVSMKVRVVGRETRETIIVPRDVILTCNKDYKSHLCEQCPSMYTTEGLFLHVRPEYPELMSMVNNNVKVQRVAIQSMTNVIEGCTKFKYEQKAHQALYKVSLIPAIEADKKNHSYILCEGWLLDTSCKDNVDYEVEGVVLANPDTQKLELIIYKMQEDEESIDSFELSEDMIERLKVFNVQCEEI